MADLALTFILMFASILFGIFVFRQWRLSGRIMHMLSVIMAFVATIAFWSSLLKGFLAIGLAAFLLILGGWVKKA
jgi:K+ transporter